jgi:hypothetical protein
MRKSAAIEKIGKEMQTLPVSALRELKGFIKTLKLKKTTKEIDKKKPAREKLLHVSVWKENDLKAIENAGKALSGWNIEKP